LTGVAAEPAAVAAEPVAVAVAVAVVQGGPPETVTLNPGGA
jgi:hypothetical protein